LRSWAVAALVASTVTPGMTPPDWSVITPVMLPVDCACARGTVIASRTKEKTMTMEARRVSI
jgi:hypothetical protein